MRSYAGLQGSRRFVFLCYRQVDGKDLAELIYALLHDKPLLDAAFSGSQGTAYGGEATTSSEVPLLDIYFDQTAPAVSNWRDIHAPALQRSTAMIVICTPGLAVDDGPTDEVRKELRWWIANRRTAPILIDATKSGDRFVPKPVKAKWPEAQRLELDLKEYVALEMTARVEFEQRLVRRICTGIALADAAVRDELISQRTKQRTAFAALALLACIGFGVALWQWRASERSAAEARDAAESACRLAYASQIREVILRHADAAASDAFRLLQETDPDSRGFEFHYLGGVLRPFDEAWDFGARILALGLDSEGGLNGVVTDAAVWTRTASGFHKQPIASEVAIESAEFLDHLGREALLIGVLDGERGLWRTNRAATTRLAVLATGDVGSSLLALDLDRRRAALLPKSSGERGVSQMKVFDLAAQGSLSEQKTLELPSSLAGYNAMTFDRTGEYVCLTEPLQGTGMFSGPVTIVRWLTGESHEAFEGMGVEVLQDLPELRRDGRCVYSVTFGRMLARWNDVEFLDWVDPPNYRLSPTASDVVDSGDYWPSPRNLGVRGGRPTVLRVLSGDQGLSPGKTLLALGNVEGTLALERVAPEGVLDGSSSFALHGAIRAIASSPDGASVWAGSDAGEVVRVEPRSLNRLLLEGSSAERTYFIDESDLEDAPGDRPDDLLPFRSMMQVLADGRRSRDDGRITSPGGRFVAEVVDGELHLFDGEGRRATRRLKLQPSYSVLALSPDGERVLVGDGVSNAISIIEVGTGRLADLQLANERDEEDDYFVAAHQTHWAWSPDGTRLAGGYHSLWMFDAHTASRICRLQTSWSSLARYRNGPMSEVAFSPSGDMVGVYLSHHGFNEHGYLIWSAAPSAASVQVERGRQSSR